MGRGHGRAFRKLLMDYFWIWCWIIHVCSVCDTSASCKLALLSMYATLQEKALEIASTSSGCFSTCITPGTVSNVGEPSVGISSGHLGGRPPPRRQGTPHEMGRSGCGQGEQPAHCEPCGTPGAGEGT